jgi:phosphate:Na+ symporter
MAADPPSLSFFMIFAGLFGGLGLFLLGMHLLTDGLKLAAGRALETLLERWTSGRARGLASGMLITGLVQSSTAVTVASIGFVNAGILSLRNALWVIFGSNVGTTLNAWLVAALGFSFKIDAFALPFIGLGAVLLLASRNMRSKHFGMALAGFGILFLGIDVLKDTFSGFGQQFDIESMISPGIMGWVILVGIGTLLTVLMQASGAVIAIVITAAQGGLISIEAACAMVIGTNIGTTSTAIMSALGATPNAKRLAAAHVFFNLITGLVAILSLPLLIALLNLLREAFEQPATPAVMIALFHSTFNVLGVLLMVPASEWLLRRLSRHFGGREEDRFKPRYLDDNSLGIPDLALRTLRMELGRLQSETCALIGKADPGKPGTDLKGLETLALSVSAYARKMGATSLPGLVVESLAESLRVLQYQQAALEAHRQVSSMPASKTMKAHPSLVGPMSPFLSGLAQLSERCDTHPPDFSVDQVSFYLQEVENDYARLKATLLVVGAKGEIDLASMQEHLRLFSLMRRAAQQLAKAAQHLGALEAGTPCEEQDIPDDGAVEALEAPLATPVRPAAGVVAAAELPDEGGTGHPATQDEPPLPPTSQIRM